MSALTVKQTAERLQVAPTTVYGLCARKQLPHLRIGTGRGTIRVLEEDLLDFIGNSKVGQRRAAGCPSLDKGKPPRRARKQADGK